MNKHAVQLSEEALAYAQRRVAEGAFPSIDAVIEAGLASLIEREAQLAAHSDAEQALIAARMATPREAFVSWDGAAMLARVRKRRANNGAGDDAA